MCSPGYPVVDNRDFPLLPVSEVIEPRYDLEYDRFILSQIETLRILMLADITVESTVPGVESHVKAAFTDKEIQLIKSKIFKLIAKI